MGGAGRKKGCIAKKWRDRQAAILNRVTPEPNTGCWLWTACLSSTGYGSGTRGGKRFNAHKLAYESFIGPVPDDLHVLHRCDVRACCNPAHLFIGTPLDNMRDMESKGRSRRRFVTRTRGSENHGSLLDEITVECLRVGIASGAHSQADWVRWTGVSQMSISQATRGDTWAHVTNRFGNNPC